MCLGPGLLAALPSASSMMFISTAMSAIGTVAGMASANEEANIANRRANYNAALAQNDATAARYKAEFDARAQKRLAILFAGTQRAGLAASGGTSQGDVLDMTAREAEIEYLSILHGGDMSAKAAEQRAALARRDGENAETLGASKMIGSLVTGLGDVASIGVNYRNKYPTSTSTLKLNGMSPGESRARYG